MREWAEKKGLLGVVGYLNGALGSLQDCVRDYGKHWERHVSLKGLIFVEKEEPDRPPADIELSDKHLRG